MLSVRFLTEERFVITRDRILCGYLMEPPPTGTLDCPMLTQRRRGSNLYPYCPFYNPIE
ncbi:hypothetical protein L917_09202, partial [Phytophthora nicotianae]